MTKIYLVRHGQDTDNANGILNGWRDTDLTDLGVNQARAVARKLKSRRVDIIFSSPLARAYQTAQIIARELKLNQVTTDIRLGERNFGVLTGKPLTDIDKYSSETLKWGGVNYFIKAKGAESFQAALKRADDFLHETRGAYRNKNLLIVTHGDLGKMLMASFKGWTWREGLRTPYFDNTEVIELER